LNKKNRKNGKKKVKKKIKKKKKRTKSFFNKLSTKLQENKSEFMDMKELLKKSTKSGLLKKRGLKSKEWEDCFVILYNNDFYVYKDEVVLFFYIKNKIKRQQNH
jgi:hypothetical protein